MLQFSGTRRRVGKYRDIEISEELPAIIFRLVQADYYTEDRGSKLLRNAGTSVPMCTVSAMSQHSDLVISTAISATNLAH
jgi:hypothetical protein